MANSKDPQPVKVRVFVRVSIPELEVSKVPDLQTQVSALAAQYPGAEIDVSMTQPRPMPGG